MERHKKPGTFYASAVVAGTFLAVVLGNKLLSVPIELMFFLVWLLIYPACMRLGYSFQEIDTGVMESCKNGLGAVLILLAVGGIISTWIAAGTVPAIIYFGLKRISPQLFFLITFWICSAVSLACGTSWGTMGTVGVAMFAIGVSLGMPAPMTAGAIVSGAFFGDMLSPMGGSANVVSAACGADLMFHCKELAKITAPVFAAASIFYFGLGSRFAGEAFDRRYVADVMDALAGQFQMNPLVFLPIVLLFLLLITRKPAILSMLSSALAAGGVAVLVQGADLRKIGDIFWMGYRVQTENEFLNTLLNRGGVQSMFATTCMMLFTCGMIGAFQTAGILEAIVSPVSRRIRGRLELTFVSQITAILGNMMGTNTFSLLMTGTLMTPLYRRQKLHPVNLSKLIAATSTIGCPLIPWNISGIYVTALFGVSTLSFAPFALLSYGMPLAAFLFVALRIFVVPEQEDLLF